VRCGWHIKDTICQITNAHIDAENPSVGEKFRDGGQGILNALRQDWLCAGGLKAASLGEKT
jgi:hypothetical protein